MGLDVNLIQFKDVDTDAIMEFARFAYEPDAGQSQRMSARDKTRELGLPESIIGSPFFGGMKISYPSKKHPESMPVGEWLHSTRLDSVISSSILGILRPRSPVSIT